MQETAFERRLRAAGAFAVVAVAGALVALGLWLEVPWH